MALELHAGRVELFPRVEQADCLGLDGLPGHRLAQLGLALQDGDIGDVDPRFGQAGAVRVAVAELDELGPRLGVEPEALGAVRLRDGLGLAAQGHLVGQLVAERVGGRRVLLEALDQGAGQVRVAAVAEFVNETLFLDVAGILAGSRARGSGRG